jgi:hypothetical protein
MTKIGTITALLVFVGAGCVHFQKSDAAANKPASSELQPSPEMRRLLDTFTGDWTVKETFEVSASRQGKARQGTASFRAGPGFSLLEDYRSNGSAGNLRFLAVLWWDQTDQVYRLLTCANNDGCGLRGTAKWEGKALVNSWEEVVDGKTARFKDSFVDIQPSSFRLVSEGLSEDRVIWGVITEYGRIKGK